MPVVATIHTVPPADLSMLDGVPGIDYADQRVTFEADDFRAAYDGLVELVTVARGGYASVMAEVGDAKALKENGAVMDEAVILPVTYQASWVEVNQIKEAFEIVLETPNRGSNVLATIREASAPN